MTQVMRNDTLSPVGFAPAGEVSLEPLIRIQGLSKSYDAFKALDNVSFDLRPGEVHVLFGENGAGKSTLIQILAGVQGFDEGSYELFGVPITDLTPAKARLRGISVVFQEFSLVPDLTVEENMFLGRELTSGLRVDKRAMRARVQAVLDRLGFDVSPRARVRDLRRSSQQMVEIAKALLFDCRVLVLDEPTASLTDHEASLLLDMVEKLRREGLGIIYISHRMGEIDRLADRITVLRDGCLIDTVEGGRLDHRALIELMTGRKFEAFYPIIRRSPGAEAMRFRDVSLPRLVRSASFAVRRGEVLGIAGLAGCGKSELIRAAFGMERLAAGEISVDGRRIPLRSPREALAAGICYFPADRSTEGLAMRQPLAFNATMAALDQPRFSRSLALRPRAEQGYLREIVEKLKIRTPVLTARAEQLSGGNKQKLMVSRGMSRAFDVFLFDEPTVGVDVQAKLEIYDLIKRLVETGKAVVVASSELAEVLHLSHRLLVMREGAIVGELDGADAGEDTEQRVLSIFFHKPAENEKGEAA